jgi:F0F1-type ATP synthase assembly protein I
VQKTMNDPRPTRLLKVIAIWSLIPSYLLAGGAIGYGLDKWLKTFPYITGIGLLFGFCLAVRDMLRLKQEWHR